MAFPMKKAGPKAVGASYVPTAKAAGKMKPAPKPKGVAKKMGDQFMQGANC